MEKLTLGGLKLLLNLNQTIGRVGVSTSPGTRDPDAVDDVVYGDTGDKAGLGAFVLEVILEVRDGLGLRERVVGRHEDGPEASLGQVGRLDEGGLVGVVVHKVTDHGVELNDLVVPGRDGHLGDVDARAGKIA